MGIAFNKIFVDCRMIETSNRILKQETFNLYPVKIPTVKNKPQETEYIEIHFFFFLTKDSLIFVFLL